MENHLKPAALTLPLGQAYRAGFTLVELLVIVAIISLLASLLLLALTGAKSSACSAKCKSNLRQIGIGEKMLC